MTTQQILQGVHNWTNGKIVYDISVAHPDGQGKPTPYADLTAALGTGGANIPEPLRKGGMSVKFIQGNAQSSDNNYVQFRCMSQNFSIKVADWQKENPLDVFIPIKGTVSIIGDSISTYNGTLPSGYVAYYPNVSLGVTSQNDMWWQKILSMSATRLDTNASYSGSMVTNGRASQGMPDFYDRCNIIGTPDNIFVALGTNDSGTSAALGEYDYDSAISDLSEEQFIPAYIKGIKALKENYPSANIFLFILSMKDTYADAIKNIGEHYNLPVIDVRSYYTNNAHPDKNGMFKIVQDVCSYFDLRVDNTPSVNSNRLVKSGGVFSAIEEHKLNINKSTFNFKVTTGETIETLPFALKYGDNIKISLGNISVTQTSIVKFIDSDYNILNTVYITSAEGGEKEILYKFNSEAKFVYLYNNAVNNVINFEVTREGNFSEKLTIFEEKIQNLRDFDGYFYDEYALSDYNQIPIPLKTPIDNIKYQIFLNAAYDSPLGTYVVKFYDDLGNVYPDNNGISLFSGNNWSWSSGSRQWENITKMLIYANNSDDYNKHLKIEYLLKKSDGIEANTVYDISAANATEGTLATYANLAAALGNNGENIPQSVRKGGMSVKFVSNNNEYLQYRFMFSTFTGSQFANPENWQGVEEYPVADSNNLVRSGGVLSVAEQANLKIEKSNFTFTVSTAEKTRKLPFPVKYGDKVKIKLNDISTTQTCVVKYIDAENNVLDTIYLISSQGGENSNLYKRDTNAVFVSLYDNATTNSVSFEVIREGNISESISITEEKIQNLRDFDGGFYDKYAINEYNQIITPLKTPLDNVKYQVSISSIETAVGTYVVKFYDDEGTVYPDDNGITLSSINNWSWSAVNRQWENITKMLIFANNSNDYSKHIKIEQTLRKDDLSVADINDGCPRTWEITTPVVLKASIKKGDIILIDVKDKTNNHTFVVQPRLTPDGENLRTVYLTKRHSAQFGDSLFDIKEVMRDDCEYLNIWDNNGAKEAKITWYRQGTLAYNNFINNTEKAILTKPLSFTNSVINNITNPVQQAVALANSLKWKQSATNSVSINRVEDKMIHGSSMVVNSQGKVFIINVANMVDNTEDNQDPNVYLRLTTFNIDTPQNREYYEIQRCGQTYDLLDGGTITISSTRPSYDPQIICDDNDNIWILFSVFNETTQTRDMYRSLWDDVNHTQKLSKCTYDYKGSTYDLSTININNTIGVDYKFGAADPVNATPGMHCTYDKKIENNETWYYIGYVVGATPVVFKTQDFINYDFFTAPDYKQFDSNYNILDIQFEMPVVWIGDYLICELRMDGMGNQRITRGIMLRYDSRDDKWKEYLYIPDANSRGTFIRYEDGIYLFHNINDRDTATLRKLNVHQEILSATYDVQYCNLSTQICYLDTIIYNGDLYAVWTSGRKSDLRFNKLPILEVSEADVVQRLSTLFLE